MPTLIPVDHDPFAESPASGGVRTIPAHDGRPARVIMDMSTASQPRLVPVDHDPFAEGAASTVADAAKSLGVGIAKGAIGLAGLPGDTAEYGARIIDSLTRYAGDKFGVDVQKREPQEASFGSGQIQRAIEGVTGEFYKPKTTAGEYAQTIGEFAPGALLPGSLAGRVGQVVVPALTSETAGQLTKGSPLEPVARFAGAIVGGVGAGLASRPGTAAQSIRGQLPPGVTPQMVDQAESLIAQAQQHGVALSWPEALSQVAQRPVMTNTMRHLEAAPQTEARMAEFFGGRPQQVETAARSEFDRFAPVNKAPSSIGPQIGRAAEDEVNFVRRSINDASEAHYTAASRTQLTPAEMIQFKSNPGYAEARNAIRNDPQLNRYVSHLPDNSIGFMNEVKKYLDAASEAASSPVNAQRNMQRAAGYGEDAKRIRNTARTIDDFHGNGDYAKALEIQERGRREVLQPLLDGYIGKLASKDLTTQNAINALFPKNPLPNSAHEISDTVGRLASKSPKAASDLVRAHVEMTFNQAARDLQTGANQAGGAKFRAQLIGNAQQEANLRAAVEALPNGAERWQGFSKFLDIMEATGTRQGIGSRTAYNEQFLREAGMGKIAGDTVRIAANPSRVFQPLVDRYQQWSLGRNLGQLANILTDPASGNILRTIARIPRDSSKALTLAGLLVVYKNASWRSDPIKEPRK